MTNSGSVPARAMTTPATKPTIHEAHMTGRGPMRSARYPAGACATVIDIPMIPKIPPIMTGSAPICWR